MHKKSRRQKTLSLDKEVVKLLSAIMLGGAQGGQTVPITYPPDECR